MNAFLFTVCQVGAESALKNEVARDCPDFRFAFSRPGFITFKIAPDRKLAEDFQLPSVFARTQGVSLGQAAGDTVESRIAACWELAGDGAFDHLHVWERDRSVPGDHDFEPGETPAAAEAGRLLAARHPGKKPLPVNQIAMAGQRILDCVMVDPEQWWVGCHVATNMPSRWPGGAPNLVMPQHAVSRAYLKLEEALQWSRLPLSPGDRCVELGSSPGGSCQALLDRGMVVTGVDPAEMSPALLAHARFTHIRARGADLKRREYRGFQWLMADSNVAPKHTLDTVEHIVTNRQVDFRGMLLTLKLPEWKLAGSIPEYLERIRTWGYPQVQARQLAHNRQEICVAASR